MCSILIDGRISRWLACVRGVWFPSAEGDQMCFGQSLATSELYTGLGYIFRKFDHRVLYNMGLEDMVYEDQSLLALRLQECATSDGHRG